jgi:predicted DsbA family dithiol-disulfide isomerase
MSVRAEALLLIAALGTVASADDLKPRPNVVRVEHRPADQNPSLGPESAPVTAELFFVPGQVESNRAYRRLVELQSRHPRRLRVVFRVITRQAQVVVPIAALEAYAQGKFEEFMDAVLAARNGTVRRDSLPAIAEQAGMDAVRLEQALLRALDPEAQPEPLKDNERRRLRQHGANVPELLFNGVPVGQTLSALDLDDLDEGYQAAYEQAALLLADGVAPRHLLEAIARDAEPLTAVTSYPAGPIDDPEPDFELPEGAPPLLGKALDLEGLPSDGDADAPVEIVVLCNLRYDSCRQQLEIGRRILDLYPHEVRLSWYPWYDAGVEGNEEAPHLHAAALCAEEQGAGWKWLDETLRQVRGGAAESEASRMIDAVIKLAGVDEKVLTACLDGTEDATVQRRVQAAIAAGVDHSPTLVIGGRIYAGGFTDWRAATPLVDGELAPGLLERLVPSWDEKVVPSR